MSDEIEELKRRLEVAERKAAIWRSQVLVILLMCVVGWVGSYFWMRDDLLQKRRTLEAEQFVVRDSSGKTWASFGIGSEGKGTDTAYLRLFNDLGVEAVRLAPGQVVMFRPDRSVGVMLLSNDSSSAIHLTEFGTNDTVLSAHSEKGKSWYSSSMPPGDFTVDLSEVKPRQLKGGEE